MHVPFITFVDHGTYDVDPHDCPLCPCCDQPLWANEPLALQTVDNGPGLPDIVRLVHTDCILDDEDDEDDEDADDEGDGAD